MRTLALAIGGQSQRMLELLGGLSQLSYQTFSCAIRPPYHLRLLIQQMDHIGVKSMSMVRELGPVLTALLVGGRVSSGMTAELGSMKVTEQIDAMRAMGANPIKKLVVPRVLSTMLVLPLLTVMADILGILGGMVISKHEFQVDYRLYYNSVMRNLTLADIVSGLGKTVIFGYIIAIVGCYKGLETVGGTEGLGKATTATVVTSAIMVIISDFFLTKFFWWLGGWEGE